MPDIPRSAVESAVHKESQATDKLESKGLLESLRDLWGSSAATLAAHGVEAIGKQLGNIGSALEHMGKDALSGIQTEFHSVMYGKRDLGHIPPSLTPSMHENAPVVSAIEPPRASFEEIMKAQAEMAPSHDEPAPEHDQGPER